LIFFTGLQHCTLLFLHKLYRVQNDAESEQQSSICYFWVVIDNYMCYLNPEYSTMLFESTFWQSATVQISHLLCLLFHTGTTISPIWIV